MILLVAVYVPIDACGLATLNSNVVVAVVGVMVVVGMVLAVVDVVVGMGIIVKLLLFVSKCVSMLQSPGP